MIKDRQQESPTYFLRGLKDSLLVLLMAGLSLSLMYYLYYS